MIVEFRYAGQSAIVSGLRETQVAFATNQLRDPAFFKGTLANPGLFREGMAALHQVVVSDLKFHPKDRFAFRAWLEEQDRKFLANVGVKSEELRRRIGDIEQRRDALDRRRMDRLKPWYRARSEYFEWVFTHRYELGYLFDPVITVHPDEVFFEAFSRDESTYARLGARYDLFATIDAFACGTTNIDFSGRLHDELDRMRSYRPTRFDIDAAGFTVAREGASALREKKIDLPESWVKGFLQVHSTMTLGLTRFRMEPVDLFNICRFLRRRKARVSPRAMRFVLEPGRRVKVVFEPWEHVVELSATAVYDGPKAQTIRTWGRDRLLTLERLIPVANGVDVYLAGQGLPTLYVVDMGEMNFTLALSGWTDNDWTGGARFDLLSRRLACGPADLTLLWDALQKDKRATDVGLSNDTGLGLEKTRSALSYLCQVGRAMYDLAGKVYRQRELFPQPFTFTEAVAVTGALPTAAAGDGREVTARSIFATGQVLITARRPVDGGYKLSGSIGSGGNRVRPVLHSDGAGKIVDATCSCEMFQKHGLMQGPCAHVLALRLAHMSKLESEDGGA